MTTDPQASCVSYICVSLEVRGGHKMPHTGGFSGSQTPSSFQPHSDIQSLTVKNKPISVAAASLHPTAWQQLIATGTASQQPVSSHLASQQLVTSPEPARQQPICQPGSQEGVSHNHRRSTRTRQRLPQSGAPSHGMFVQTEDVENQKISIWIFLSTHAWLHGSCGTYYKATLMG